jgi:hypothetical protein
MMVILKPAWHPEKLAEGLVEQSAFSAAAIGAQMARVEQGKCSVESGSVDARYWY